jgi:hypothetical protein
LIARELLFTPAVMSQFRGGEVLVDLVGMLAQPAVELAAAADAQSVNENSSDKSDTEA